MAATDFVVDALGQLHVGLRSVPLPPKEQALAALLLCDFGRPVQREALVRAAWPDGTTRVDMLASRLSTMGPGLPRTGHPGSTMTATACGPPRPLPAPR